MGSSCRKNKINKDVIVPSKKTNQNVLKSTINASQVIKESKESKINETNENEISHINSKKEEKITTKPVEEKLTIKPVEEKEKEKVILSDSFKPVNEKEKEDPFFLLQNSKTEAKSELLARTTSIGTSSLHDEDQSCEVLMNFIKSSKITESLNKLETMMEKLKESIYFMDKLNNLIIKEPQFEFPLYQKAFLEIISHIKSCKDFIKKDDCSLAEKFWSLLLMIVTEAFFKDQENKMIFCKKKENWYFFKNDLEEAIELMEHEFWKNLVIQQKIQFLNSLEILEESNIESYYEDQLKNLIEKVEEAITENANLCEYKCIKKPGFDDDQCYEEKKESANKKFRMLNLMKFKELLTNKNVKNDLFECLKFGRFDKAKFSLSHSIILGRDGGIYLLMNSLSDDEYNMLLENDVDGTLKSYFDSKIINTKQNIQKKRILIGKGSLGKIRIGFPLALTEKHTCKMALGEIICIKKTNDLRKVKSKNSNQPKASMTKAEVRENMLNDYGSVVVSKYIHSPDIYDMNLVFCLDRNHSKGYTMQEFKPIPNGEAFKSDVSLQTWEHQKAYFLDIFAVILKLLNDGIAMTDLKPANTLYCPKEKMGKLIDLAGVVIKANKNELRICRKKYIREYTPRYTAPEILDEEDEIVRRVDLFKALSYTLGKMIKDLIYETKKGCPDMENLKLIIEGMMETKVETRWEIEKGFKEFEKIGGLNEEELPEFDKLIKSLQENMINNKKYEDFGLKRNIEDISSMMIQTYASKFDPDYEIPIDIEEIQKSMEDFIIQNDTNSRVYLLLGTAGTGKSSILQMKYINKVKNWIKEDAFPFYMDLATGIDLKSKWEVLNENLTTNLEFSVFARNKRSSMILFLDGYDESRQKRNLINIFLRDLGYNKNIKIIITCRTDYLPSNSDELFKPDDRDSFLLKRYIVPLTNNNKFELKKFIHSYCTISTKDLNNTMTENEYNDLIQKFQLKEMMRTNAMAFVVLEVIPQLKDLKKSFIAKFDIFKIFTVENIKKEENKIKLKKALIKELQSLYAKNTDLSSVYFNFAKDLAFELHIKDSTRIDNIKSPEFFNKYLYNESKELKLQPFYNLIRILSLNFEIQKEAGKKKLIIGFPHDTVKNYYLLELMIEEWGKNSNNTLESLNIVQDENLIKFIAEFIQSETVYQKSLKECIKITKNSKNNRHLIAASNAITILVAANVSFVNEDLSDFVLRNTNIRDGIFTGCNFTRTDLSGSNMINCKLEKAIFDRTIMKDVTLKIYHQVIQAKSQVWCLSIQDSQVNGMEEKNSPDMRTNDKIDEKKERTFHVAAGCNNGEIKLYEIVNNQMKSMKILSQGGHTSAVNSISFSTDGKFILSGSVDHKIMLWDRETVQPLKVFLQKYVVKSVCFSFDGTEFICCFSLEKNYSGHKLSGRNINLCETETGNIIKEYEGHCDTVNCVCFSQDGNYILSGSDDFSVRLWNKTTGNCIKVIEEHHGFVNSVCFSSNGKQIVSCSSDKLIMMWASDSGKLLKTFKGHTHSVNFACFTRDNSNIISASDDNTVRLWNIDTAKCLKVFEGHTQPVMSAGISPDNGTILSGSWDNTIWLWDKEPGKPLKLFEGHSYYITSASFSPDGKTILTGSGDNTIRLWCRKSGKTLKVFTGHTEPVNSVNFSTDGKLFISGSDDKTVILWDFETGQKWKSNYHTFWVSSVCFSPDQTKILSGSFDKKLILMDANDGGILRVFQGHSSAVTSICFSQDGKNILSGSLDKIIILWSLENGNALKKYKGHTDGIMDFKLNTDGTTIVSCSKDKTIRLWSTLSGIIIKTLEGHTNGVNTICFSPDEKYLLSGSRDNTVKLWDKEIGKEILNVEANFKSIKSICFSKDGNNFITAGIDHTLKIYSKVQLNNHENWILSLIIAEKETPLEINNLIIKDCLDLSDDNYNLLKGNKGETFKEK